MVRVHADTDQEEVAQIVARYNLLAVPVIDEEDRVLGVITVDDVIDRMLGVGWRTRRKRTVRS